MSGPRRNMVRVSDQRKRGWFWGEDAVLSANGATSHAKLVYLGLAKHADEGGRCWPSILTLAAATSLGRTTVKKGLAELEGMDPPRVRVDIGQGPGAVNVYVILGWPSPAVAAADEEAGRHATDPVATRPTHEHEEVEPHPVATRPGRSPRDRGSVATRPGVGRHATTEGIPSEGIPNELEPLRAAAAPPVESIDVEDLISTGELVAMYNAMAERYNARRPPRRLSLWKTVSPGRLRKLREYVQMFPRRAWWVETFAQYDTSPFLLGKTKPTPGHESFVPDLDWLLSKGKNLVENCVKAHDGKYEGTPATSAPQRELKWEARTPEADAEVRAFIGPKAAPPRARVDDVDEDAEHELRRQHARDQARSIGA